MALCIVARLPSWAPLLVLLLATAVPAQGRRFTKCGLVRQLRDHGVPEAQLPDWVCMTQNESGFRSHTVSGPNKNRSYDHGIFQINDKYWCGKDSIGGDCNIKCSDLSNDDIGDDIVCAKKIHRRHGFSAWYAWRRHCDGKALPSISDC